MTDKSKDKNRAKHPAIKGMKSSVVGMTANLILALIKGVTGILGNSYALIADSIESLTDAGSSFIVWAGLKISSKEPDTDHPYGHGKAEPLASILVCLCLLTASVFIIFQSIKNIQTPHELPEPFTIWVLLGVVICKEILFKKAFEVGNEIKSTAVKSDAWHHRSDAITSLGALMGITIALIDRKSVV